MYDSAFTPQGPTYTVSGAPVQAISSNRQGCSNYRIRNLATSVQYFGWAPPLPSGNAPTVSAAAPTPLNPSANTIGMVASSVEVFSLTPNAWFNCGTGATFEVTPGEGM